MIKEARKPSADPTQEKLRQNKAVWNKDVSAFLNDVIHIKKLMNGWPSKFYKERSKIVQPIPGDPGTILGSLANDFQELAQRGTAIVAQQAEYSKNRRQSQPKAPTEQGPATPATPAAPTPPNGADLSKQLAAWEQKYELVSEGSNPVSRFITRLRTPQMGFGDAAQKRRLRMDMLKAAAKSYKALSKMQIHVTKSSKASVVDAYKAMQISWNEWSIVSRNFTAIVNSMPDQPPRVEEMRDEPPPGVEPDLPVVKEVAPEIAKVPEPAPVKIKPLVEDMEPPLVETPKNKKASEQLEVVAQAFLKKWLGRTRHQILPTKSSGLRLQIYQVGDKTRKNINNVMDLLEKGLDIQQLGPKISEVSANINSLRSLMRSLHNTEKPTKGPSTLDGIF